MRFVTECGRLQSVACGPRDPFRIGYNSIKDVCHGMYTFGIAAGSQRSDIS